MNAREAMSGTALALLLGACGSPSSPQPTAHASGGDGLFLPSAPLPVTYPPPWNGPYPASHAPLPSVTFNGGFVLTRPTIVSIDFEGDDLDKTIQDFSAGVGATDWWNQVREGYCDASGSCIGAVTHRAHVTLPALSNMEKEAGYIDSVSAQISPLRTFIRRQLDLGLLPAPTPQSVYMFYMPVGVPISVEERQGCSAGGFGGYHDSMTRNPDGTGTRFPYAIMPRCTRDPTFLQRIASHELIEAATDPFRTDGGYAIIDLLWSLVEGGEVADMCVDLGTRRDTIVENGLTLQRSWSNAAVARGGNPCVPVPAGEVYFNLAPSETTLSLAYGETTQIALDAFSDGQGQDWKISAVDFGAALFNDDPYLKLSLDQKTANNGTRVILTLTAVRPAPHSVLGAPFVIISENAEHTHVWPGVVYGR